ncbi:Peroxidase 5 [Bienertia sinuspersici]
MEQIFLVLFWALSCPSVQIEAQLNVGFYRESCPLAEQIVKEEVMNRFMSNNCIAPGLVRMHFHDCFVGGCDGSVVIDSTSSNTAKKDSVVNNPSLRGFNVIDNAKTRLESQCAGVISCADILAFAARDNIEITRRLAYDAPTRRRDGRISLASKALQNIPTPTLNNFNRINGPDPTLNPTYAAQLQQQCPEGSTYASLVVPMDPCTPFVTDVNYYRTS